MIDPKLIKNSLEEVKNKLAVRGYSFDADVYLHLEAARKETDIRAQNLQSLKKKTAKQVGLLIKEGMPVEDAKAKVKDELDAIERDITEAVNEAKSNNSALEGFLMTVPNLPAIDVPVGKDEADNLEVKTFGEPKKFDFPVKDHVDIGCGLLGGLDFDAATKISGARFSVLKGPLAQMHRALTQFMLNTHINEHGYTEVYVPYLVNAESLRGTGQLPKFEQDLFKMSNEKELYLIPTAEVPVTNLVRDEIVSEADLPMKLVCHTPCFRSEAGSHGKDTRGMIRQHQFEKVELVQIVPAEQSEQAHEELTGHAETILEELGLPYRKVILCGGDLGFSAQKTYDLEVWLPAQETYREISSCSSFGDYQARRMGARQKVDGKTRLLHTVNGSGLAVGRTLVAILENFQNADGTVTIPDVLAPYMGGASILKTA